MKLRLAAALLAALVSTASRLSAHDVADEMAGAATNFLAELTPEQRARAMFQITDPERENWHFVPRARNGLPLREMSLTQQQLAHLLIASALSHRGFYKAETIMSLDQVLYELENHAPRREPGQYYLSIFGTPGVQPWGWRVEGHHLSLNFLVANGRAIATSPAFFGANPAQVRSGPRAGLRVLSAEEDLARKLVRSFTPKQAALAIIATNPPSDILTGTNRQIGRFQISPPGISANRLNEPQFTLLRALLEEYLGRFRPEVASSDWARINSAGRRKLFFAWAGGTEPGQGHYYRIQGQHFMVEYDCTQNDANHIHTVWRDFENDFGDDLLKLHYERFSH